jgi:hypothetical protein
VVSFQGHHIFPDGLFLDVLLSLWSLAFLLLKKYNLLPKIGRGMSFKDYFLIYIFILFIPNSTYGFFEIKHLIVIDHIADPPNTLSWLVFGGASALCLACTLIGNMLIVHHFARNKQEIFIYYSFLSLICGFGAVVGLLDFSSIEGLIPLVFPLICHEIIRSPSLIFLALGTSAFLFSLGFTTHRLLLHQPSV